MGSTKISTTSSNPSQISAILLKDITNEIVSYGYYYTGSTQTSFNFYTPFYVTFQEGTVSWYMPDTAESSGHTYKLGQPIYNTLSTTYGYIAIG